MRRATFSAAQARTLASALGWSTHTVVSQVNLPDGWRPQQADLIVGEDAHGHARALIPVEVDYLGEDPDMVAIRGADPVAEIGRVLLDDSRGATALLSLLLPHHDPGARLAAEAPVDFVATLTDVSAVVHPADRAERQPSTSDLLDALTQEVRGQDVALRTLAERVSLHAARRAPQRPLTVFMVGPTGVGKTKTAEVLARTLATEAGAYLRLDMSEFQEAHRVSQLFGSPQGYAGYGDGAVLLDTLAAHPRAVVVFDEIDKAHASITRALMNGMDAGRLSRPSTKDGEHTVDCTRALFVFTSNQAADEIERSLEGQGGAPDAFAVDHLCRRALSRAGVAPEIVGRIGCFLAFRPIGKRALTEIVTLSIARVALEYGITLASIDPGVVSDVLAAAHGSTFGARPYEYVIDARLAPAFVAALSTGDSGPHRLVAGPPLSCEPLVLH